MITFEKETEAKSYIELFTHRSSFRRLLLAVSIQASVQMTGVSAIQYYSPTIFAQIGIPGSETLKYQGISSIIAIIAQFCCILFIDYTGRRWAMIGGNLVSFFLSFSFPHLSTFHILGNKNMQLILPFSSLPPGKLPHLHHRLHPPLQIPPGRIQQQSRLLGLHRHHLDLQLLLQRHQRSSILDHPGRNFRHAHTLQRSQYRNHDIVCIQHNDWPSHTDCD